MAESEASREKRRIRARAWRVANPDKVNARLRAYVAANREKVNAAIRARRARPGNERKNAESVRKWGLNHPIELAYITHKYGAKKRNIPFVLTFDEWWEIWHVSGKWEQRGKGLERYVMARFADHGPYAVGNVRICTGADNLEERWQRDRGKPMTRRPKTWRYMCLKCCHEWQAMRAVKCPTCQGRSWHKRIAGPVS